MNIRQEVSDITGYTIRPDKWDVDFGQLDKDGRLNMNKVLKLVLMLIKRVEKLENDKS